MCGGAAHDHHGYFARVKVELLVFTHCSAGCVERGHKNLPFFEAEVFVDDIAALVKGRNKEVAEMAKKVMKKLKEKKGLKLSVTEKWQGRHYASKNMGSPCGWIVSHGEVLNEETDVSCGRKKEHDLPVLVHGSIRLRSGR